MNSTQGVMEACYNLFMTIEAEAAQSDIYFYGRPVTDFVKELLEAGQVRHRALKDALQAANADTMPAGALYALQFGICVNDYIKRPGMIDDLLHRPRIFKRLTAKDVQKRAGMDTAAFAQMLYDICTEKGRKLTPADDEKDGYKSPMLLERCLYASYVYNQVAEYLERQNAAFVPVPFNKGMQALALINTGIADIDENTKQGKITVGDVVFSVIAPKISTGALMLNDFFLKEAYRTQGASVAIPLREYAEAKKRSTTKQALQKLKAEVLEQMQELKPLHYSCQERIGGKLKTIGRIDINGGTAAVVNGVIYWNYNQDLFSQLLLYAPTDYPAELWAADPRTSTYYFGRYIAQNRRLNEGKPGREKIYMRTLVEKSPNLPTYAEVMKGNRNIADRIIKKAFADLDALETLYYDFYTAAGQRVDNPAALDYQTFIDGYIMVDYTEYPAHPDRVKKRKERQKKAQDAKEKAQLEAAAKAAAEKAQEG